MVKNSVFCREDFPQKTLNKRRKRRRFPFACRTVSLKQPQAACRAFCETSAASAGRHRASGSMSGPVRRTGPYLRKSAQSAGNKPVLPETLPLPHKMKKTVKVGNIECGSKDLFLISGPCVIEDESIMMKT